MDASAGHCVLRIIVGVAANCTGLLCVIWPVLPKHWGAWEFVGRLFVASDDPSRGIQFMFFWLMTVPLGAAIAGAGTRFATKSNSMAAISALGVGLGGVQIMLWIAGVT
jgi:hypothetical protein